MTTELFYLLLTAIWTGCLWIPVVIGYVRTRGLLRPADYVEAPKSPLPAWVERSNRAHMNAVEGFAPFAAVVLIAHVLEISTQITQICAVVYFVARVAHSIVQISGFPYFMARTNVFTVLWAAFLVFAVETLRLGI